MYAYLLNIVCTGKSSKNRFLSSLVRWSAVQSPNLLFTCKTLKQTLHKEWTGQICNYLLSIFCILTVAKNMTKSINDFLAVTILYLRLRFEYWISEHVFKDQVDIHIILMHAMFCICKQIWNIIFDNFHLLYAYLHKYK